MAFEEIEVSLCGHWGGDEDAARAAWASSYDLDKVQQKSAHDVMRVVTGIVNNQHDTPKERLWLEFFITCPIAVERQFDKYRMTIQFQDFQVECLRGPLGRDGITQNELSGRYRTIPERYYGLPDDVYKILKKSNEDFDHLHAWDFLLEEQYRVYRDNLAHLKHCEQNKSITNNEYKRAREVLRMLLGTAFLTDMRIVMNMNAFEHIINQRLAPASQLESRIVAYKMIEELVCNKVNETMVKTMISKNGWEEWLHDLAGIIGEEAH